MSKPRVIVLPKVDPKELAEDLAEIVEEVNASLGDPTAELTGGLHCCTCCPVHGPHHE